MTSLLIVVFVAASISAICSTTEAMLYSVPPTFIEKLKNEGSKTGLMLSEMKSQIDRPITSVLTLNTIVNTAGSAVAGALASKALGEENLVYFTIAFTILILSCGEILPKIIGVVYAKPLAQVLVYPLHYLSILFTPMIKISSYITKKVSPKEQSSDATDEDISAMASLSRKSGEINYFEESAINNILALDKKRVSDILTPRTVVFSLPAKQTIAEVMENKTIWHFSRIPVYNKNNEDIVGLVQRRSIAKMVADDKEDATLESIMSPVKFVHESVTLDKLLTEFLESRQHLFVVLDEYSGLAGVVSLEDVLEEVLGHEIVDESDAATDMREVARELNKRKVSALITN